MIPAAGLMIRRCVGNKGMGVALLATKRTPCPTKCVVFRKLCVAVDQKSAIDSEFAKGAEHLKSQRFDEAFDIFSSSLQQAQAAGDKQREIASLQGVAAATMGQGEFEQSVKYYEQLIEKTPDDIVKNANAHLSLGAILVQVGNMDKAMVLFVKGLEKTKDAKRDSVLKRIQRDLAWSFIDTAGQFHKYKELKNFVKNIKYLAKKDKDLNFEIDAYTRCANVVAQNSTTYAKEFIDEILQLVKNNPFAGLQRENWQALITLATIYKHSNDLPNAESYFKQALDYAKSINDSERILNSMQGLGTVYQNRLSDAISVYQDIIKYCKEIGNIDGEIGALLNMAIYYTQAKDTAKAEEFFNKARVVAKQHHKVEQDVLAQAYLAVYHLKLETPSARPELMDVILQARPLENKKPLRMCLEALSDMLIRESKWKESIETIKELLPLQTGDMQAQVRSLGQIQHAFKETGDEEGEANVLTETLFGEAGLPWLTKGLARLPKMKR